MREVIVWETVHNALWQTLAKEGYESVISLLIRELEDNLDLRRTSRHPEDETLFYYFIHIAERGRWHTFEFIIDDTTADTSLFVIDVIHESKEWFA